MEQFWKIIALTLLGVILWLVVNARSKDISVLLTLAVCCAVAAAAIQYLRPVLDFLGQLVSAGQLEQGLLAIVLKAVGVGLITEITGMICADAGNASMGGMVRFFGSAVILSVSVPVFQTLLDLLGEILGVV